MAAGSLAPSNDLLRKMNSFSGVDIRATFGSTEVGELQAISYAITREKAPIYTMGRADPRAFSRGKRGIAGSLIFIMFDRNAMLYEIAKIGGTDTEAVKFSADDNEQGPSWATSIDSAGADDSIAGATSALSTSLAGSANFGQVASRPWYADQIPPFDVTLVGANEYGAVAVMRVIGLDLLNEGYGVSIDDVVSEMQYTYVARMVLPWIMTKENHLLPT